MRRLDRSQPNRAARRRSMRTSKHQVEIVENPRDLRVFGGKLGASVGFMMVSFLKEAIMVYSVTEPSAAPITEPLSHLNGLIEAAKLELLAAEAAVDIASAALGGIEPHPHAHGHTAGKDCIYAGIGAEQYVNLAGLLAQPWRRTLGIIEMVKQESNYDYLLKALPLVMAEMGDSLVDDGTALLAARANRLEQDLPKLFERKPVVVLGLIWRLFGFHCRDSEAWVGIFAYRGDLSVLITSTGDMGEDVTLGDALTAAVAANHFFLTVVGKDELCRRAASRDAERQASWADVPNAYRESGSWRGWAPTKRQRHLMHRIETARGLPLATVGRRGDTSDWIIGAGGNPRFAPTNVEKS